MAPWDISKATSSKLLSSHLAVRNLNTFTGILKNHSPHRLNAETMAEHDHEHLRGHHLVPAMGPVHKGGIRNNQTPGFPKAHKFLGAVCIEGPLDKEMCKIDSKTPESMKSSLLSSFSPSLQFGTGPESPLRLPKLY